MTPEEIQAMPALVDNDTSNEAEGEEIDDNETGPGGNSAKTPVSLLQVYPNFIACLNLFSSLTCVLHHF